MALLPSKSNENGNGRPHERRESVTRLDPEGARLLAEDAAARYSAITMLMDHTRRAEDNQFPSLVTIVLAELAANQRFADTVMPGSQPQQPAMHDAQAKQAPAPDPYDNFTFDEPRLRDAAADLSERGLGHLAAVGFRQDAGHQSYVMPVDGPAASAAEPDATYYQTLANDGAAQPVGGNVPYGNVAQQPVAATGQPVYGAENAPRPVTDLGDYRAVQAQQEAVAADARAQIKSMHYPDASEGVPA